MMEVTTPAALTDEHALNVTYRYDRGEPRGSVKKNAQLRLEGLPPEARIGAWVMEWYWKQPDVPHIAEFVATVKKRTGRVPTYL